MDFDIVIVGGGPAGLAAALTLGRARRRVLLCDSGPRRNAAAEHMHNFVTRDGTPPQEFRRIGRAQLEPYGVDIRDAPIEAIRGERGAFEVTIGGERVGARAIVLCTGMIDELPPLDGLAPLWGTSVHICPYCHGWEIRDGRFGYLATHAERLTFPVMLRGWARELVVYTQLEIPPEMAELFAAVQIRVERRPIVRLQAERGVLASVELADGERVACDALFLHPPQRQVALVGSLGLATDAAGYIAVNEMRETSVPGIYAAGDLITPAQTAISAANAGTLAAGAVNHALAIDDARRAMRRA
jgi:thioredoxin reductase